MTSGLTPDPPASGVREVKRLTSIEAGTMTNDDRLPSSFRATPTAFIAAAQSSTHEKSAVSTRRSPLTSKEQVDVATAEERLVQELRPLARVLLIQARRELARRAREAQTKVA
ncbi:MAG: hypothetical protein ACREEC_03965 [Thermoplasmata archaeon]